jgi:hypothetical protein
MKKLMNAWHRARDRLADPPADGFRRRVTSGLDRLVHPRPDGLRARNFSRRQHEAGPPNEGSQVSPSGMPPRQSRPPGASMQASQPVPEAPSRPAPQRPLAGSAAVHAEQSRAASQRDSRQHLATLGIEAPWLQLDEIAQHCIVDPDSIQFLHGALDRFRQDVDVSVERRRDAVTGQVPDDIARAKDACMQLHEDAWEMGEAFRRLDADGRGIAWVRPSGREAMGRAWIARPGEARCMRQALDEFKIDLDHQRYYLALEGGPATGRMLKAEQACLELFEQGKRALDAYEYLDFRGSSIVPPEVDLRCVDRAGIDRLREDLADLQDKLDRKIEGARGNDRKLPQDVEQAAVVCRSILAEASTIANTHELRLSMHPDAERRGAGAQDPRDRGLFGMEAEASMVYLRRLAWKGVPLVNVAHGTVEGELKATEDPDIERSGFESVAFPLKNPRQVDLFTRSTEGFCSTMSREARLSGAPARFSSTWPAQAVIRDNVPTPVSQLRSGVAMAIQPTAGIYYLEHVPLALASIDPSVERAPAGSTDDARRVDQHFARMHGRPLSRNAFGFLNLITYILRCGRRRFSDLTPHSYFEFMPRKTLSSMFERSLATEQDREDIRRLLDPDLNAGTPLIMEVLGHEKSGQLFRDGYIGYQVAPEGAAGTAKVEKQHHGGPSIDDFLVSIFDPQRFGRSADFISPPEGQDDGSGHAHGMAGLGNVDPHTGEMIFEIRQDSSLPFVVPASALPVAGMLNYIKWCRFNPNIPAIHVADRAERDVMEANRAFTKLSDLFYDLKLAIDALERDGHVKDSLIRDLAYNADEAREVIASQAEANGILESLDTVLSLLRDRDFRELQPRAETLAGDLYEVFPRLLRALYGPEHEAWEKWLQENPPSPGMSDVDFAELLPGATSQSAPVDSGPSGHRVS